MQNDGEADANKLASADAVAESLEALKVSPDGVYETEKSGGTKETVVPATMEGVAEGAAEGVKEEGYMTDEDYEVDEEGFYEQVPIEDMEFDSETEIYSYPCPCGDKFLICVEDLEDGEVVARCPSCTLIIKVLYDPDDFVRPPSPESSDQE